MIRLNLYGKDQVSANKADILAYPGWRDRLGVLQAAGKIVQSPVLALMEDFNFPDACWK